MKKFLKTWVLFFAAYMALGGILRVAYDIPTIKTLSGSQTITNSSSFFSGGFQLGAGTMTSNPKVTVSGALPNGLGMYNGGSNQLYFINDATENISGTGFNNQNTTRFVHVYGSSLTTPFLISSGTNNGEGGGTNGFQGFGSTSGGTYMLRYAFIDGAQSSGIQLNSDGTGTRYDTIWVENTQVVNVGQEGAYNGATHVSPIYATLTYVYYRNFIAVITGREGLQIEHGDKVEVDGVTLVLTGQNNVGSQNNGGQWHDNKGYFKNFIMDSVKGPGFNIFGSGQITNGRIRFFNSTADIFFIGDVTGSQYGVTSRQSITDTLVVRDVDFEYIGTGTLTNLVSWNEKVYHVKFINCRKTSNITNWYVDQRVGGTGTGTITFVNCTNFTPPPGPKFKSYYRYDYANYYRLLPTQVADDDYKRGRGAYTRRGR